MDPKEGADVLIDGKIYSLSGSDQEYLQKIANYINAKIDELKKTRAYGHQSSDYKKIMVYLNLADDYFREKDASAGMTREKENHAKEIYQLKHDLVNERVAAEDAAGLLKKCREELESAGKKTGTLEKELKEEKEKTGTLEKELKEEKEKAGTLEAELEEEKKKAGKLEAELEEEKKKAGTLETELKEEKEKAGMLEKKQKEAAEKAAGLNAGQEANSAVVKNRPDREYPEGKNTELNRTASEKANITVRK